MHHDLGLSRLDALLNAHWEKPLAGDVAATRECLRIIDTQCKLLGLYDQPHFAASSSPTPFATVIVTPEQLASRGT